MFSIDLQSRTPIYEQLCKKITERILKGELKAGDKIPSVRELAKELGVNPNTVSKAFGILEHDKIIYSLAGRGSFVADMSRSGLKEKALEDFAQAVGDGFRAGLSAEEMKEEIDDMEKGRQDT